MKSFLILAFAFFSLNSFAGVLPNTCYLAPTDEGFGVRCGDRTQVSFSKNASEIMGEVDSLLISGYRFMGTQCSVFIKYQGGMIITALDGSYEILACTVADSANCANLFSYLQTNKLCRTDL